MPRGIISLDSALYSIAPRAFSALNATALSGLITCDSLEQQRAEGRGWIDFPR
jgi:hypothetical protein